MGRRKEPRVELALPVRILGMDAEGRCLLETTTTVNVSRRGVVVKGIHRPMKVGDTVSLKAGRKMVRYRVVWAGQAGTPRAGQLGLERIDSENPWDVDLPGPGPDPYLCERGRDRRQSRRFRVSVPVTVNSVANVPLRAQISDMSPGGCYVTTLFPLAAHKGVTLVFWLGNRKFELKGMVCTSIAGLGMGIQFAGLSAETKGFLTRYLEANGAPAYDRREDRANKPARETEATATELPASALRQRAPRGPNGVAD